MAHQYSPEELYKRQSIAYLKSSSASNAYPSESKLSLSDLTYFTSDINGKIVFPWSPDYNEAKADFNNVYPAYPIMIVYVASYSDIRKCLALAQENNIETVIRSGGHSLAGYSVCDGMIIDMSSLNNVYVDAVAKTAFVESGTVFQKLIPALEHYNLHIPSGGCPSVAVAGYMQGGGYGLTSRSFGMQCDNVIEVTVMLSNGKIVVANENQNQDLLWAVCGGTGGNFGVLLSIKFKLHDLGDIYGIKLSWTFETEQGYDNASKAIQTIQDTYLPKGNFPQLGIETIICRDFDVNNVHDQGVKKVYFGSSWIGTQEDFEIAVAPLMALEGVEVNVPLTKGPYSQINSLMLENTPPLTEGIMAYSRSAYFSEFHSQDDWKSILKYYATAPNRYAMIDLECYGGAINDVAMDKNSFIHRNNTLDFYCDAFFNSQTNDQQANDIWIEKFFEFLKQYSNGHSYQNYPNRNQKDFKWAYWGESYERLLQIKKKYDPTNFFQYQQSIGAGEDYTTNNKIETHHESIQYEIY